MQVYAVYYEQSGRFLLGSKLKKGYYFYNSSTGKGEIKPNGQPLNGGGNFALPGGKREGTEPITTAARREFTEETAAIIKEIETKEQTFSSGAYSAAYFKIADSNFNTTVTNIIKTNLPQGLKARDDIINRTITAYNQIHQKYPQAPQDNELEEAYVWDVTDPEDWAQILKWKDDPVIGWYYEILEYLKLHILN
ncbi:MAG: NUDIX domain-containing protein [Symploca sp. SIO2E9]|nr:NUDIX domain-containing protein [Symploca sp. SIO2E9]